MAPNVGLSVATAISIWVLEEQSRFVLAALPAIFSSSAYAPISIYAICLWTDYPGLPPVEIPNLLLCVLEMLCPANWDWFSFGLAWFLGFEMGAGNYAAGT